MTETKKAWVQLPKTAIAEYADETRDANLKELSQDSKFQIYLNLINGSFCLVKQWNDLDEYWFMGSMKEIGEFYAFQAANKGTVMLDSYKDFYFHIQQTEDPQVFSWFCTTEPLEESAQIQRLRYWEKASINGSMKDMQRHIKQLKENCDLAKPLEEAWICFLSSSDVLELGKKGKEKFLISYLDNHGEVKKTSATIYCSTPNAACEDLKAHLAATQCMKKQLVVNIQCIGPEEENKIKEDH